MNEIERKFKILTSLDTLINRPELEKCKEMANSQQGYLFIQHNGRGQVIEEIRLSKRLQLTHKKGFGLSRYENITEISKEALDILWPLTYSKRVCKTRYFFKYLDYLLEVDEYQGENYGLITAEIEFNSLEEALNFKAPDWLGLDVTNDPSYTNANLIN